MFKDIFFLGAMFFYSSICYGDAFSNLFTNALSVENSSELKIKSLKKIYNFGKKTKDIFSNDRVAQLLENSKIEKNQEIRGWIFKCIIVSKHSAAFKYFTKFLNSNTRDLSYLLYSLSALGALNSPRGPDEQIQEHFKTLIKELNGSIALQLNHKNPNIRYMAVRALGKRRVKAAIPSLVSLFESDLEQIKKEVVTALVKIDEKKILVDSLKISSGQVVVWLKKAIDEINRELSIGAAQFEGMKLIQLFIYENENSEDESMQQNIAYLKEIVEENKNFAPVVLDLANYYYLNLNKIENADSVDAQKCKKSYEVYFSYPEEYRTKKIKNEEDRTKYLACSSIIFKKKYALARFYLKKSQIRRNAESVNSAILILSKLLLEKVTNTLAASAGLYLSYAYVLNQEFDKSESILNEITEKFSNIFTKKDLKIVKKIMGLSKGSR